MDTSVKVDADVPQKVVAGIPPVVKKERRPPGRAKGQATEKQIANLAKGFAVIKANRERKAAEKAERIEKNKELAAQGLPLIEEPPKLKKKDIVDMPKIEIVEVAPPKERKKRKDIGVSRSGENKRSLTAEELMELKVLLAKRPAVETITKEVEKIVEKPVERIVEREKIVSGSALLDKLFFK